MDKCSRSLSQRSLGIRFDPKAPDGFYINSLAGDDEDKCRAHVKALIRKLTGQPCAIHEPEHAETERVAARIRRAELWREATSPVGTPVEPYFDSRGCTLAGIPGDHVIRFHPACPFGNLQVPAMLALITDVITGEPIGVHRTASKDDGSDKRLGVDSKRMLGVARRGAVRLRAASEYLGIAEGLETALSAAQVFGAAVWATTSAAGIAAFPILKAVKRLTVFADNDEPGLEAACRCCRRYQVAGIDAEVRHPTTPKTDWNDFVMKGNN